MERSTTRDCSTSSSLPVNSRRFWLSGMRPTAYDLTRKSTVSGRKSRWTELPLADGLPLWSPLTTVVSSTVRPQEASTAPSASLASLPTA
ncbi:hypothetical protein GQ600_27696 [Phytophthora cactorum]|nr:hypothetical protein GQ600_27696 [Phytophthora cactorum]